MPQFQESDVRLLLKSSPDRRTADLGTDTALVKSLTRVLNATLEIAHDPPESGGAIAMALSKKALAVSGVASKALGSKELDAVNFVGKQALKTIGLAKLAGMTPVKASVYLTLTMADKVVSAAGIAQMDKCKVAIASLTTTTGTGAWVCFSSGAFTLGIGCVAGAIAIAADAFDVYGQCYGPLGSPAAGSSSASASASPSAPASGDLTVGRLP